MTRFSFAFACVALALASCTPLPAEPPAAPRTSPRDADAKGDEPAGHRATVHYELRGRPFPLPLVTGSIAGQRATMVLDTGANAHVVAGWYARKLGLKMTSIADGGTDHVGRPIATYRIEKPEMAVDGWGALEDDAVLATEVPEFLEKLGVAGFLSPQRLASAETDAVMLDLAKGEMRLEPWDAAIARVAASGSAMIAGDEVQACLENETTSGGVTFIVPTVVEGIAARLLVDSGAQHSDVFTSSSAGGKLLARSTPTQTTTFAASGKISSRRVKGARVTVGSFEARADVDIVAGQTDPACPRDGVIAMDLLRTCSLVLGRARVHAKCLSSAGRK